MTKSITILFLFISTFLAAQLPYQVQLFDQIGSGHYLTNGTYGQYLGMSVTGDSIGFYSIPAGDSGIAAGWGIKISAAKPRVIKVDSSKVSSIYGLYDTAHNIRTEIKNNYVNFGDTSSMFGTTSNVVARDKNGNTHANNFESATSTYTTTSATYSLTAASSEYQITTGGATTFYLPNAETLHPGHTFSFNNNGSGDIYVYSYTGALLSTIYPGAYVTFILETNTTTYGLWDNHGQIPSNAYWSSSQLSMTGGLSCTYYTAGTYEANIITGAYGGTGYNNGTYTEEYNGNLNFSSNAKGYAYNHGAGLITYDTTREGSLTSFSSGNFSPLFTTSVSNPTTTPGLSFAVITQPAATFYSTTVNGGAHQTPSFLSLYYNDIQGVKDTTLASHSGSQYQLTAYSGANTLTNIANSGTTGAILSTGSGSGYPSYITTIGSNITWNGQVISKGYLNDSIIQSANTNIGISRTGGVITLTGNGGTVTSVATGYGLLGGTITSTGTLKVDTTRAIKLGIPTWWALDSVLKNYGAGTVTSFSAGNLNNLFTTSVTNSTTTPALAFTLTTVPVDEVLIGGTPHQSTAAPTWRSLFVADLPSTIDSAISLNVPSNLFSGNLTFTKTGHTATGTLTAANEAVQLFYAGGTKHQSTTTPVWRNIYGTDLPTTFDTAFNAGTNIAITGTQSVTIALTGTVAVANGGTGVATAPASDALMGGTANQGTIAYKFRPIYALDLPGTIDSTLSLTGLTGSKSGHTLTLATVNNGTVTSFSAGNLSPLFTTGVTTASSTPALAFTLTTVPVDQTLIGGTPNQATAAPTWRKMFNADLPTTEDTVNSITLPTTLFNSPLAVTVSNHIGTGTMALATQTVQKFFAGGTKNQSTAAPTWRAIYGNDIHPTTLDTIISAGTGITITGTQSVTIAVTSPNTTYTVMSTSPTFTSTTTQAAGMDRTITPNQTGDIIITITGNIANSTTTDGAALQIIEGTGTAPSAHATTGLGTAVGTLYSTNALPNAGWFSCTALVTGLALGTAVWVDEAGKTITGGTATLTSVTVTIYELP